MKYTYTIIEEKNFIEEIIQRLQLWRLHKRIDLKGLFIVVPLLHDGGPRQHPWVNFYKKLAFSVSSL